MFLCSPYITISKGSYKLLIGRQTGRGGWLTVTKKISDKIYTRSPINTIPTFFDSKFRAIPLVPSANSTNSPDII